MKLLKKKKCSTVKHKGECTRKRCCSFSKRFHKKKLNCYWEGKPICGESGVVICNHVQVSKHCRRKKCCKTNLIKHKEEYSKQIFDCKF